MPACSSCQAKLFTEKSKSLGRCTTCREGQPMEAWSPIPDGSAEQVRKDWDRQHSERLYPASR